MIPVDSSAGIDYLKGTFTAQTGKLDALLGHDLLAIGDFVSVVKFGQEIAIQAAKNFRVLRKLGVAVRKTIDTVIATRCIESGYELLHTDRDFDPFARHLGLRVVVCTRRPWRAHSCVPTVLRSGPDACISTVMNRTSHSMSTWIATINRSSLGWGRMRPSRWRNGMHDSELSRENG
ncbi:MAG TPA: hypothetical protein VN924_08240 [Bryobacteraceae bacterium]|nr:hypothetical protein [Bryobacteraceae bacterium]